jgi:hypothetical protein
MILLNNTFRFSLSKDLDFQWFKNFALLCTQKCTKVHKIQIFFVLFCTTDSRCNEKRKDTKTDFAGFGLFETENKFVAYDIF